MEVRICLLAIAVLSQSYPSNGEMELESVQVLFRHGERTPLKGEYAALHYTDKDVYEPFGLGQLTNYGKKQAYKIGRMLRQRYDGFLNQTYNREDIYAHTAELDRSQASLQLVLAGLYPSGEEPEWYLNRKWSPIPYRCIPGKLDVLFRQHEGKKAAKLLNDVMKRPEVLEKLYGFADLYIFLNDKGGAAVNNTFDVLGLFNTLLINMRMGIPLPTWYSHDLMIRLSEIRIFFSSLLSYTPEMRRIMAGPLIKTFLERLNLDGTTDSPTKMYFYSGSDYNVGAVTRALGVDGFRLIDFANTLILEKLRGSPGQVYVRLLEWDALREKLIVRKMNDCDELCPADDFMKICSKLIPSDEEINYLLDEFPGRNLLDLAIRYPTTD